MYSCEVGTCGYTRMLKIWADKCKCRWTGCSKYLNVRTEVGGGDWRKRKKKNKERLKKKNRREREKEAPQLSFIVRLRASYPVASPYPVSGTDYSGC